MSKTRRLISIVGVSVWKDIPPEKQNKKEIQKLVNKIKNNPNMSVEMSICSGVQRLPAYQKDEIVHHLLAPSSEAAVVAAQAIQQVTEEMGGKCIFNENQDRIDGLDPYDSTAFLQRGLPSLLERIRRIVEWDCTNVPNDPRVLVNVTSGYKAITPYTSAMAFLYRLPLIYKYEQSSSILVMHPLPVELDTSLVAAHYEAFAQLRHGASVADWKDREDYQKLLQLGYIDEIDEVCALNGTGSLLLFAFERNAVVVDITREAREALSKHKQLNDVAFKFAGDAQLRENKTELKNGHLVYDDGDNPFRIFYEKGLVPRIYGAFADHDEYERQLRKPKPIHIVYKRVKILREQGDYIVQTLPGVNSIS
ncbi:hypothetical protein [Alicyclobacillus fructus]|uniref:hypothetical protein n=1 Tax=Alicyclobacillus fructus TaxID=2816082 RepID=UPI001A8DD865|nr:hypothetical protein [Alicyclobacillus fructus]